MGLTIHYSLSLPQETGIREVKAKLEQLRQRCLDLPVESVSEMRDTKALDIEAMRDLPEDHPDKEWFWWSIQSGTSASWQYTRGVKPHPVSDDERGNHSRSVRSKRTIGFRIWPGKGCEEANVGLNDNPKTVAVAYQDTWNGPDKHTRIPTGEPGRWHWRSFCKTQYANDPRCGGLENFLRCHLAVVAMLDAATEIGFSVTDVSDESGFYEHRDIDKLIQEIREWDVLIAGAMLAMENVANANGLTGESAMDGRPDREHLEAKAMNSPDVQRLIKATTLK